MKIYKGNFSNISYNSTILYRFHKKISKSKKMKSKTTGKAKEIAT